jgi:hypothetical protein
MIAETTRKQYRFYIEKLKEKSNTTDIFNTKAMIDAVEGLRKADGTTLGATTKRNYYIALASFTKLFPSVSETYKKAYQEINKGLKSNTGSKPPPPPPAIPYEDLQTIGLMIMGEAEELLENRILAGLVTQLAPVRLDYSHLKIFPAAPKYYEGNYIVLGKTAKTSRFVAQKHKTAKHYGALKRTLTSDLYDLIKEWKAEHPDAVLLDVTENALGRRVSSLFKRYLGESVTMNDIRHSYVTNARKGDRSKDDVEAIAHNLGHSLAMNYDYRRD